MEVLELTARELLFAASRLGAQTFFGLPDPFFGMDEADIAGELVELQLSLEKKGYASMGFDDVFKLSSKAEELIAVCANCERYIVADLGSPDGVYKNLLFYALEDKAVAVYPKDGDLTLRTVEPSGVAGLIWEEMFWPEVKGATPAAAHRLSFACIVEAQNRAGNDPVSASNLLKEEGCPAQLAEILLCGLRRKAYFYSISMADLKGSRFEHLICVCTKANGVLLTASDADCWDIRSIDGVQLRGLLAHLCDNVTPEGGDAL